MNTNKDIDKSQPITTISSEDRETEEEENHKNKTNIMQTNKYHDIKPEEENKQTENITTQ